MSDKDRTELEAWLAADRRHRGAFLRARAGLHLLGDTVLRAGVEHAAVLPACTNYNQLLAGSGKDVGPMRQAVWRWAGRLAVGTVALAATVAGVMLLGSPGILTQQRSGHAMADASEVLKLRDGSVATLDEGASIAFFLEDGVRKVVLLKGEARFQVAKDREHPFVVQSGDVFAQATGTVYSVRRVGRSGGWVSVAEGSVLVWSRYERDQAVHLHAGGTLTLDPGPVVSPKAEAPPPPSPPPPDVAQFAFDDTTIVAAAARFNRANTLKIVVADPVVGETRIVGLFRANDPERFAQAAAAVAGGTATRQGGRIVIDLK